MRPGDIVGGRFEIDLLAGAGGMGEVFRARDRATGALVAVKALLGQRAADLARFEREARVLSGISHSGIVRYLAHGVLPSGRPYIAMEWLEGEDLSTRLAGAGLAVDESVTLAQHAAEALGAAHARGIVHRDLKPSNLFLVGGDPKILKLLDFGVAWLGDMTRVTKTGLLIGTPGYMAPEQARSEHRLDGRVDDRVIAHEGRGRWALSEVLRRQGDFEAAEREALAAVACLSSMPLDQTSATAALAAAQLAQGRAAEALVTAQRALERCAEIGACGMFRGAFIRLVHVEALFAAGTSADVRAALVAVVEARERLLAIAGGIDDPAYRRSFLERVPENARTLMLAERWAGGLPAFPRTVTVER